MNELDVLALDRTLARAAAEWLAWRRALAVGEGVDYDPFVFTRAAVGRAQLLTVRELPAADPLRARLERWIFRLAEQRINRAAIAAAVARRRVERHLVEGPARGCWTVSELVVRALREGPLRAEWLERLLACASELRDAEALLWERRQELGRRLGYRDGDGMEIATDAVRGVLPTLEDALRGPIEAVFPRTLAAWLEVALGSVANDGWPARVSSDTLAELLRGTPWTDRVSLDLPPFSPTLAPASFARGLSTVGRVWARSLAPARQPFVVARDPYDLPEHTQGALVALLLTSAPFLRRRLGVAPHHLEAQRRAMGAMLLCHARALGLALELRAAALGGRRAFETAVEEASQRALGFPLPPQAAGILFRPRSDGASRLAGLLLAARRVESLVEQFDDDWFRNPRVAEALRGDVDRPPAESIGVEELAEGVLALRRLLQSAL